jgi:hypothetical protein
VTLFESMENDLRLLVDPGGVRKAYLAELDRFLRRSRATCQEGEIEYHRVSLDEPLDRVLLRFLSTGRKGS